MERQLNQMTLFIVLCLQKNANFHKTGIKNKFLFTGPGVLVKHLGFPHKNYSIVPCARRQFWVKEGSAFQSSHD